MKIMRSKKTFFGSKRFLATEGTERQLHEFRRGARIFSQGEPAESLMYIQKGGVKFSVVNSAGKEAVVAMYGPGDFIGVGCISGQAVRMGTATAMTPVTLLAIGRKEMLRVLHNEPRLSDHFVKYVIGRNIRMEADLVDQLFNPCEKRLARTLLLLAGSGKQDPQADPVLPKVSQKTLAAMIGTTRSRVNFFMNKFRRLGLIECNGNVKIKKTLLAVTLREQGSGPFAGERRHHGKHLQNVGMQPANAVSPVRGKREIELR
jgi:CRP/FNR family transcriptional regulator, cyclic AMP receptor protein